MSSHDYSILTPPASHDHFPSAFMHGYSHYQSYDHERYSSHLSSQPSFDRYFHATQQEYPPRDSHLLERRISDPSPHLRPSYSLPRQAGVNYSPPSFEYVHAPLTHSTLLRCDSHSAVEPRPNPRDLVDFNPRPPHAGWTPKEEVDEDETKELLANNMGKDTRSPLDSHLAPIQSSTSPRNESLSPGDSARGNLGSPTGPSKTFSFVSLPGNAVRKRPRRRYDEIERLYACSWPDCAKAYGTLNHLNAHITMQRHGSKRSPTEFKELRKQWRQQRKQDTVLSIRGVETHMATHLRRRRATESSLTSPGRTPAQPHLSLHHRLSLEDIRYSVDDDTGLGTSPTSTASEGVGYWQDSPVSNEEQLHHNTHFSYSTGTHASPPLSPHLVSGLSPQVNRLPPDSTLLTPLPGYRPPSPSLSCPAKGNSLLQPLHSHRSELPPLSPESHLRYGVFEGGRHGS